MSWHRRDKIERILDDPHLDEYDKRRQIEREAPCVNRHTVEREMRDLHYRHARDVAERIDREQYSRAAPCSSRSRSSRRRSQDDLQLQIHRLTARIEKLETVISTHLRGAE